MEFLIGALVGGFVSLIIEELFEAPLSRLAFRLRRWHPSRGSRSAKTAADLEDLGFLQLVVWSPARPLDASRHRVLVDARALVEAQEWFTPAEWAEERERAREGIDGEVCSVTGYTVDHGEAGPGSLEFVLTVRPSLYADSVAVQRLCGDGQRWAAIREAFHVRGGQELLRVGPAQSYFVALTISTRNGEVLCLRRAAGAVVTAPGLFALGVCETSAPLPSAPGHEPEDLFALAYRAAREEVGIDRRHLGPVWFSWFGVGQWDGPFVVAHVETSLSTLQVEDCRREEAPGSYEADAIDWIDFDSQEFRDLAHPELTPGWLPFTCLMASGLQTMRTSLGRQPSRRRP